jgi:hypothetical protein
VLISRTRFRSEAHFRDCQRPKEAHR